MAKSRHQARRRASKGAASVETAVVLALFLVPLLLGLTDVARLLYTRISIQEAAQEGAIFYAFNESIGSESVVVDQVRFSVDSPTIATTDVSTSCTAVTRTGPDASEVEVTVSMDVDLIFPFLGGPITVSRTATAERFFECPPWA
jgi:Flp pilus assembly protein TadG